MSALSFIRSPLDAAVNFKELIFEAASAAKFFERSFGGHPAVDDDAHPIAQFFDKGEDVRGEEDALPHVFELDQSR